MLADSLGFIYIDTGAMYRAVTYLALKDGISCEDEAALARLAASAQFALVPDGKGGQRVYCNGEEVTTQIREPRVTRHVSLVSSHPLLRQELLKKQQEMAGNCDVVMDGRDIGTVVLPKADFKIFLTASEEVRVQRRHAEMQKRGYAGTREEVRADLIRRDRLDSSRTVSPLRAAAEAVIIDTTDKSPQEVVREILDRIMKTRGEE